MSQEEATDLALLLLLFGQTAGKGGRERQDGRDVLIAEDANDFLGDVGLAIDIDAVEGRFDLEVALALEAIVLKDGLDFFEGEGSTEAAIDIGQARLHALGGMLHFVIEDGLGDGGAVCVAHQKIGDHFLHVFGLVRIDALAEAQGRIRG